MLIKAQKGKEVVLERKGKGSWMLLQGVDKSLIDEDGSIVVATTHHSRTNDLTMSKTLQWAIK